jgi:hypothetical protein
LFNRNYIFVGNWNSTLQVFDASDKEYQQLHEIELKTGVRTLCVLDGIVAGYGETLVIGENDGWIELLRLDSFEMRISKKFEKMGHIYQA